MNNDPYRKDNRPVTLWTVQRQHRWWAHAIVVGITITNAALWFYIGTEVGR